MAACTSCGEQVFEEDVYYSDTGDAVCPSCYHEADADRMAAAAAEEGAFAPEMKAVRAGGCTGILLGLAMMGGAVLWFVAGLFADRIFFYPPILFLFGLFALGRGVLTLGRG